MLLIIFYKICKFYYDYCNLFEYKYKEKKTVV